MVLYLVRHAKAGSRWDFDGPDDQRPLTAAGRVQAHAIAERLADAGIVRVLSSPYARCVQTVEPLATRCGLTVELVGALAEGRRWEPVLGLLDDLPEGSLLCTHGDVLPDVLRALVRRGMEVVGPDDQRKAVTWHLERSGTTVVRGWATPPPGAR